MIVGIIFGYVIAQFILVKYLKREKADLRGCLITAAILLILHCFMIGEASDCLAIIAGCAVGHLITHILLREN